VFRTQEGFNLARDDVLGLCRTPPLVTCLIIGWSPPKNKEIWKKKPTWDSET